MTNYNASGAVTTDDRRQHALARVGRTLAWLCLAGLGLVAGARVVAWDSRSVFVGLNALTPVLFLPAWVIALGALARHRWLLAGAAGALVLTHLAFVLPEVMASEPVPRAARTAPKLRLLSGNVYAFNRDPGRYAEEIRRTRPDVIVLLESTPAFLAALDASGVTADLPHRVVVPRPDPFGAAVISRWPVVDHDVVFVGGRPILIRATVEFPTEAVRVFGFHAVSPVAGLRQEWSDDLERLGAAVAAEARPVLVAGDFNATWGHRAFRRLLDHGLTDAAAARGDAFHMTWPRNRRFLPPVMRIDHVLTSPGLVVTGITTGTGAGSDHRPLVADVAVMGSGERAARGVG